MIVKTKKANELSLQTIVIFIIAIITLIVMIYFITTHIGGGNEQVSQVGDDLINQAKSGGFEQ